MPLPLTDGRVEVYKPGNQSGNPDLVVRPPDLMSVDIEREIQRASGNAKITINNIGGTYAGEITAGDRLEFVGVGGGTAGESTFYGDGTYGNGAYGGQLGNRHRWTGLAGQPRYRFRGVGQRSVTIGAQPFVFGIMGSLGRKVDNAFRGRQVDVIAKTILEDEASVLDPSGIESFPNTSVDIEFDGTPLLKAMAALADQADAVLTGRGTTVHMRAKNDIPTLWEATPDDFEGGWDVDVVDDELWNQVRVEGGTANNEGDAQTTQTGYQTVTAGNPITHQINLTKSRIDELRLWTRRTGSGELMTVGIQEDVGGAPTAVGDETKDLAQQQIPDDILEDPGFTDFLFSPTELPDEQPWLIVRSDGNTGLDVGVDGSGNPAYRAFYPFDIITQKLSLASINEYRRREHRIQRDNVSTSLAAAQLADRTLRRHEDPRGEFESAAGSQRAHNLNPGTAIELDIPEETAVGTYLVTGRTDNFAPSESERNLLRTDLRLEEVETF